MYSVPDHTADFLEAIRSGKRPNADIEIGHRSTVLIHLANILARSGKASLAFDPETEQFVDDAEANALVRRTYREGHWAVPRGVLTKQQSGASKGAWYATSQRHSLFGDGGSGGLGRATCGRSARRRGAAGRSRKRQSHAA